MTFEAIVQQKVILIYYAKQLNMMENMAWIPRNINRTHICAHSDLSMFVQALLWKITHKLLLIYVYTVFAAAQNFFRRNSVAVFLGNVMVTGCDKIIKGMLWKKIIYLSNVKGSFQCKINSVISIFHNMFIIAFHWTYHNSKMCRMLLSLWNSLLHSFPMVMIWPKRLPFLWLLQFSSKKKVYWVNWYHWGVGGGKGKTLVDKGHIRPWQGLNA